MASANSHGHRKTVLSVLYLCVWCALAVSVASAQGRAGEDRGLSVPTLKQDTRSHGALPETDSNRVHHHSHDHRNHNLHHHNNYNHKHPHPHPHHNHHHYVQTLDIEDNNHRLSHGSLQEPPHIVGLSVHTSKGKHVRHKRDVTEITLPSDILVNENTKPSVSTRVLRDLRDESSITNGRRLEYVLNSTTPESALDLLELTSVGILRSRQGSILDHESMPTIDVLVHGTLPGNTADVFAIRLRIIVQDINEAATFVTKPVPNLATVSRTTGPDYTVITLLAVDPDVGANRRMEYKLVSVTPDSFNRRFKLVQETITDGQYGVVRRCKVQTAGTAQFSPENTEITITLSAQDSQDNDTTKSTPTTVLVLIGVRPPQFYLSTLSGVVDESAEPNHMIYTDQTQQTNLQVRVKTFQPGDVTFTLQDEQGRTSDSFTIDNDGYVRILKRFDYEELGTSDETLTVVATQTIDGTSLISNATLRVSITDVNDNGPNFEQSQYENTVREDILVDTSVLKVKATDADSGLNAVLDYSLIQDEEMFYVDTTLEGKDYVGTIRVKSPLDYDRTPGHSYRFTVVATDRGATKRSSTSSVRISIENINDEEPVFTFPEGKTFEVIESATVNTVVTQIQATDLDGDKVKYFLTSSSPSQNKFSINEDTGLLILTAPIAESDDLFRLNLRAQDDGSCCGGGTRLTSDTYITVEVTDVNTHKPNFTLCSTYSKSSIDENAPFGTSVLTVRAEDGDRGANGRVTYSITTPPNRFQIGSSNGTITVDSLIDREATRFISVTVKGEDGGDPVKLNGLCSFRITVNDVNDNPPIFDRTHYVANITSDVQPSETFFVLRANDRDVELNGDVEYSMVDDAGGIFGIRSDTGYVFLADGHVLPTEETKYDLVAMAKDKGTPSLNTTVGLTINVKSGFSQPPEFVNYDQRPVQISEMAAEGTPVISGLQCNSRVQNNPVVDFQLIREDGTPSQSTDFFKLSREPGDNVVNVLSTGNFDFEEATQHTVRIRCLNQQAVTRFVEIQPTVQLLDANNKVPQFEGTDPIFNRYEASVAENQTWPANVIVLVGSDADVTTQFNSLTFSIVGENSDFEIVQENSEIHTATLQTKRVFDREQKADYFIYVNAMDGAESALASTKPGHNNQTVTVHIRISDINDSPPSFNQTMYNISIPEDFYSNTAIDPPITATDPDSSDQGKLQYLIIDGNVRNTFGVRSGTGHLFLLRRLDYEGAVPDREFRLKLKVSDRIHSAVTEVLVTVTDVNDNEPVFVDKEPVVDGIVEEDPSISAINRLHLVKLHATDADARPATNIQYYADGYGSGLDGGPTLFEVDRTSGDVYLVSKLDRDPYTGGRPTHIFTVRAEDEPVDPLTGFAYIHVNLLDINDNNPYFESYPLEGSVEENCAFESSVMVVLADDPDAGENGTVSYQIDEITSALGDMSGYFKIESNGLIRTAQPATHFDRERDPTYYLVVRLNDGGFPSRSTTGTVTIHLRDQNDNVPEFSKRIYRQTIAENHPINYQVLEVIATDADEDPQLVYSLLTDKDFFKIENIDNKGSIQLYKPLDYEKTDQRFFNITVQVDDTNTDHRDTCYAEITVTDFNDNPPVIEPETATVHLLENVPKGTDVANFTANDLDSGINAEFEFSIERQSDKRRFFYINATTGEVKTRRKLDREENDQHILIILATDKGSPPMAGTATLTVLLDDVNDNYPTFKMDYHPHVPEDPNPARPTEILREVQEVLAYDPDLPPYGAPFGFKEPDCRGGARECPCSERPSCVEFQFKFNANGAGGNGSALITTSKSFDRETQKYYEIPIVMWDMYGKNSPLSLTGTNTLTVTIADINDEKQNPGHQDVFVYNYKGQFGPLVIGRVYVDDKDDWDLPDKTFTYVEPSWMKAYFKVDRDSGNIVMEKGVPSNTPATPYTFYVDVFDRVESSTVRCSVSVVVEELSEQAVMSSGAVRLNGTTAEEFIKRTENGKGVSMYDHFRKRMAEFLDVDPENVQIVSIMDVGEYTDVRYAAHGSPYYHSGQTDSVVVQHKNEFESLGFKIAEVPIDACAEEEFEGGCYNFLNITGQPAVVNANGTSYVGVEVFVQAEEGCRALTYPDPVECSGDYCYNGGTCHQDDFGVLTCECEPGFDGQRCQQLRHSFDGNGFAMYPMLEQCEDSQTSIEFITTQDDGLILYNGPMGELLEDQPRDFIALELLGGYPVLHIDHGSGHARLELNGRDENKNLVINKLSDGQWHRIDVLRSGRVVEMVLDNCEDAVTDGTLAPDTTPCRVRAVTPGPNSFLNVATLLQLGGRSYGPSYQPNIGRSGFNGCVRNLRHNTKLYDLHFKKTPGMPSGENGCPREDDICGTKCGDNGVCSANLKTRTSTCVCKPTWRGNTCNTKTTKRDLKASSYLRWSLSPAFGLSEYKMDVHIMFRTRDKEGVLFTASSDNSNHEMTLEIRAGRLNAMYSFGDGQQKLELTQAEVSNGQWHAARIQRVLQQVTLTVDDGEGRNYNFSAGSPDGQASININNKVYAGAAVSVSNGVTQIPPDRDLTDTCIQDIRIDNKYLPIKMSENSVTAGASLTAESGVEEGCERDPQCIPACVFPKGICHPLWDIAECRCSPGYHDVAGTCESDCLPNPCFQDVACSLSENGTVQCACPPNWYDQWTFCRHYGDTSSETYSAGLTAGAIASIVVSIIVVLACVLLAFLLISYFRKRQSDHDKMVVEDDDDFDIRENVMFYDEEGAGEEDQEAYDLAKLPPPASETGKMPEIIPRTSVKPSGKSAPSDRPDVGNVLQDRLRDAEEDPDAPPYDTLLDFNDEGAGSTAGSLSSLNTTSSDASQDYDYLNNWGPKFAKLADMYGAGQDQAEDM